MLYSTSTLAELRMLIIFLFVSISINVTTWIIADDSIV